MALSIYAISPQRESSHVVVYLVGGRCEGILCQMGAVMLLSGLIPYLIGLYAAHSVLQREHRRPSDTRFRRRHQLEDHVHDYTDERSVNNATRAKPLPQAIDGRRRQQHCAA